MYIIVVGLSETATTQWAGLCFVCTYSLPLAYTPTPDVIFYQHHIDPYMGVALSLSHMIYSYQGHIERRGHAMLNARNENN